jgi:PIN domain nuclease of toxin-antitoxin system
MRLLLDTHVFLWMNDAPEKLSTKVRDLFARGEDDLFLSIASPWEIQIKQQIGKLAIAGSIDELLAPHIEDNSLHLLPIEVRHIRGLGSLPQELHLGRFAFVMNLAEAALDRGPAPQIGPE